MQTTPLSIIVICDGNRTRVPVEQPVGVDTSLLERNLRVCGIPTGLLCQLYGEVVVLVDDPAKCETAQRVCKETEVALLGGLS